MKGSRIVVKYDPQRTNLIPPRYELDRQSNYGKGQKSISLKIDIKYYLKLKKVCDQRSISFNRAINFAIAEFIDYYLIR